MKTYWFRFKTHDTFYMGKNFGYAFQALLEDLPNFPHRKLEDLIGVDVDTEIKSTKRVEL